MQHVGCKGVMLDFFESLFRLALKSLNPTRPLNPLVVVESTGEMPSSKRFR